MNKAPIFQHRHYKALAVIFADFQGLFGPSTTYTAADVTEYFANKLQATNPRFDRARFLAAASGKPSNGRDRVGPFAAGLMAATNGEVRS